MRGPEEQQRKPRGREWAQTRAQGLALLHGEQPLASEVFESRARAAAATALRVAEEEPTAALYYAEEEPAAALRVTEEEPSREEPQPKS